MGGFGNQLREQTHDKQLYCNEQLIADSVICANNTISRCLGLMFRPHLQEGVAFIIPQCRAVHSCFMRFSIDVVFCDDAGNVRRIISQLKPWRFTTWASGSKHSIELAPGTIERLGIACGKQMKLRD